MALFYGICFYDNNLVHHKGCIRGPTPRPSIAGQGCSYLLQVRDNALNGGPGGGKVDIHSKGEWIRTVGCWELSEEMILQFVANIKGTGLW